MKKLICFIIFINIVIYSQDNSIPLFLLVKNSSDLAIEKIELKENETQVFTRGGESENITLILPYSEGISGDFVKSSESSVLIARNKAGNLVISVQKPDGTQKELVNKPADELKKMDIKVNITGLNTKKVFKINSYKEISVDTVSPVIDMFQGKIPLGDGDYSITTEISVKQDSYNLNGEFELEYFGGYYFAKMKLPGGKTADMIVDLGAASSVITKNIPDENTPLNKLSANEISAEGMRKIDFPLSGFGGIVKDLVTCNLKNAVIGNTELSEHSFIVIDSFKTVKGRKIDGIIGLDIISAASNVLIKIPAKGREGKVILNSKPNSGNGIPFEISHGHIFINGKFNGEKMNFLLDSGSPFNFISYQAALNSKITLVEGITVYGADRTPVKTEKMLINDLDIESKKYSGTFYTSEKNILAAYGLNDTGGILGTEFLNNFHELYIDFESKKLIFK